MKNTITAAAPMDEYQAQDDMRTLTRAEEIKADAMRHSKAMSHGKKQMSALQAVVQPDADDKPGVKEKGEGTKAEEAMDAKQAKSATGRPLPKRGMRAAAVKRPVKVNQGRVI